MDLNLESSFLIRLVMFLLQTQVWKMGCSTSLRSMERSRRCRYTVPLKSDMVSSFSANKRTKRKLWEHQRESFFLACKSMSQPGMALVWSYTNLYHNRGTIIGTVHGFTAHLFFRDWKWEWVPSLGWEDRRVSSKGHSDIIYWKPGEDHHLPRPP